MIKLSLGILASMNRFEQFFIYKPDKPISTTTINSIHLQKIGEAFTKALTQAFDANLMDAHKLGAPNPQQIALTKTLNDINEFVAKVSKNSDIFSALVSKQSQ
ncbi:hypothetical protein K1X76_10190 [bacterium]|nr:hypothetical protein [bacterium]